MFEILEQTNLREPVISTNTDQIKKKIKNKIEYQT